MGSRLLLTGHQPLEESRQIRGRFDYCSESPSDCCVVTQLRWGRVKRWGAPAVGSVGVLLQWELTEGSFNRNCWGSSCSGPEKES